VCSSDLQYQRISRCSDCFRQRRVREEQHILKYQASLYPPLYRHYWKTREFDAITGTHPPVRVESIIVDGPAAAAPLKTTRKTAFYRICRWRSCIHTASLPDVRRFLPQRISICSGEKPEGDYSHSTSGSRKPLHVSSQCLLGWSRL